MKIVIKDLSKRMNIGETGWSDGIWTLCNNAVPNYILLPEDIKLRGRKRQIINRDYDRMNLRKLQKNTYVGIPVGDKYSELTLNTSFDLLEKNIRLIKRIIKYFYVNNSYGFEVGNMTVSEYKMLYSHPENEYLPLGDKEYWLIDPTGLYIGNKGNVTKAKEDADVTGVLLPVFKIPGECIIDTDKKILITPEDVEELKKL